METKNEYYEAVSTEFSKLLTYFGIQDPGGCGLNRSWIITR